MPKIEVPQRNELEDILRIPHLVAIGKRTDSAICSVFGETARQGRYLIHGAVVLGIIDRPRRHDTAVTPLGRTLMTLRGDARNRFVQRLIANAEFGQAMLRLLDRGSFTLSEIVSQYQPIVGLSTTTTARRVPPILTWLTKTGLIQRSDTRFELSRAGRKVLEATKGRKPGVLPKGKVRPGRAVDAAYKTRIEKAAVEAVVQFYSDQGFDVVSCEKENRGWDLEITDPLLSFMFHVEVKGTSRQTFIVELTPNEFRAMREKKSTYRVCIITDALQKPIVHEFVFDAESKKWLDTDTSDTLKIVRAVAARLSL